LFLITGNFNSEKICPTKIGSKNFSKHEKMKSYITIGLLVLSNIFMTLAWYGHLKFKELKWFENAGLITVVFISWGLGFF
jgi:hypothetical protein